MERRISDIARGQDALLTLAQARADGMTRWVARYRVESGRWERAHRGVYRLAGAPRSWRQDLLAACLAAGRGAVASHRAAACLWELDAVDYGVLEISVVRSRYHRLDGVVVHRSSDLSPAAATVRHAIPVTTPARTLVDLGAVVPARIVELALDSALGRRLVTVAGLRLAVDAVARRGRSGAGVLRSLLEDRSDSARMRETALEARMRRLSRDYGLPRLTFQHEVRSGQRFIGRVDFADPQLRLAIEVDGFESHSSLDAFRHDRARQNELVAARWTVLRFTWDDVANRPERVANAIRRVLVALRNDSCA